MKISKQELVDLRACEPGLARFIKQTNDTDESVEVSSLVGGENTYGDLLWLAGKTLPRNRIVKFACDCALINVEKIKPYSDEYELIVEYLRNPSANTSLANVYAARAARAAADTAVAAYAARAATHAVYTVRSANDVHDMYANRDAHAGYAANAATYAAVDAADAVKTLLKEIFNHE